MNEKILLLERSLRNDLDAIQRIYGELGTELVTEGTAEETLIVRAYRLHNLYNACENLFRNIAATFENQIDDHRGWHSQLLQRMKLDLMPLRPAVIDDEAYEKLEELLRFRHFFRNAYGVSLDPERFALAQRKALELRPMIEAQLGDFLDFLGRLRE